MRILLALAILAAALATDCRHEAAAQWCAQYDPYTYTCGFVSFNQCLDTVRGVGGACRRDPNARPPRGDDRPQQTMPSPIDRPRQNR
jgi:hypothetical protein